MVTADHFRTGCLTVGLLFIVLIIISDGGKIMKTLGIIFSIGLMVWGFLITGEHREKIEELEVGGSFKGSWG